MGTRQRRLEDIETININVLKEFFETININILKIKFENININKTPRRWS